MRRLWRITKNKASAEESDNQVVEGDQRGQAIAHVANQLSAKAESSDPEEGDQIQKADHQNEEWTKSRDDIDIH